MLPNAEGRERLAGGATGGYLYLSRGIRWNLEMVWEGTRVTRESGGDDRQGIWAVTGINNVPCHLWGKMAAIECSNVRWVGFLEI